MPSNRRRQRGSRSLLTRICPCCGGDDEGGGRSGGENGSGGGRGGVPDSAGGGGGGGGGSHGGRHRGSGDAGNNIPLDPRWTQPRGTMGGKTYAEIKRECLEKGTLYVDPDFPADIESLDRNGRYVYQLRWKRPKEIAGPAPVFTYGDRDYHDMEQGSLGNCWFVASVACILSSPQKDLMKRVIPRDQGFDSSEYCGAFRFNFWQYGNWVEVVVDDRLPTLHGALTYAHNIENPNEYWCPLLEKAFAKLRGSYNNIHGGRIFDAMVDMTGGIGESVKLKSNISSKDLAYTLIQGRKMNSCMGVVIFAKDPSQSREQRLSNGLYTGHAYSIINVKKTKSSTYGEVTLVHVRNPWSKGEWNGPWSDNSAEFHTLTSAGMKAAMKRRNDGEFWISVDDLRKNFDELELCHLTPDSFTGELARNLDRAEWKRTEYFGAWVKGKSAGGPLTSYQSRDFWSNPQYKLDLSQKTETTSVIISLFEIQKSYNEEDDTIAIGFVIFKHVGTGRPAGRINRHNHYHYKFLADSGLFSPYRERARQYFLDPGYYVIVPTTYHRNQASKFYLRIFSEEDVVGGEAEPEPEPVPEESTTPRESKALRLFNKKAGTGGVVDAYGLHNILNNCIENMEFSLGTCRSLAIFARDRLEPGMINKEQFERLLEKIETWMKAFRSLDANNTGVLETKELKRLFEILNFDSGVNEVVDAIMSKYGGKEKTVTEDDFIQSFVQVLNLIEIYRALKQTKQLNMTHHEPQWIATAILI